MMDYVFPYSGKTIEETLKDAFTSASVATSSTGIDIRFGTNSTTVSAQIPVATRTSAGAISAEMVEKILQAELTLSKLDERIQSKIPETPSVPIGIRNEVTGTYRSYIFSGSEGAELYRIAIPIATSHENGLMTAEDKQKVDNMQEMFYARSVSGVQLTANMPMGKGALCYDVKRRLLLIEHEGLYYQTWGILQDPNGKSGSSYYQRREVVISAAGKMYTWNGDEWTTVGDNGDALKYAAMPENDFEALRNADRLEKGVLYLTY